VDLAFVDAMCDLIELQGGVAGDLAGSWGEKVVETLTNGGFRHSHEPLINHGSRTKSISQRIKRIASTLDPLMFADGDVVHGDFDHRNVLREDGTVTAVIDWDSFTCVGDRYFDLATLVYSLEFAELDADTETYALQRLTSTVEPAVFAAYAAYLSLRFCTWMLVYQQGRENYDDWLERFLSRSERWLDLADELLAGDKP
jgi:aminoglycoside phosphotransferase (APT) family kinase protein